MVLPGPWQTSCFPDDMPRETFYEPTTGGYERAITERLRHWQQLRSDREAANDTTTDADGSTAADDA